MRSWPPTKTVFANSFWVCYVMQTTEILGDLSVAWPSTQHGNVSINSCGPGRAACADAPNARV